MDAQIQQDANGQIVNGKREPITNGKTLAVYACDDWQMILSLNKRVFFGNIEISSIHYVGYGNYILFYKLGLGKEVQGNVQLEVK